MQDAEPTLALAPQVEPDAKLVRGSTIGRYVILGAVGEGGMGVVYRAYDPDLDRSLALKFLKAHKGATGSKRAAATDSMVREARALAKLSHPNVLAIYDVGLWDDGVYLATEYVAGGTLRRWWTTARPFDEIIATMVAAGKGLAAAHRVGLIHRDFKPDNVLVGADGEVRVIDFGLARLADDGDVMLRSSVDAASLGL